MLKDLADLWKDLRDEFGPWAYVIAPLSPILFVAVGIQMGILELARQLRVLWPTIKSSVEVLRMAVRGESIWAVGFGNSVELRRSKRPPRAIRSEFEKDTEVKVPRYEINPETGRARTKWDTIPRKIHLQNVIHVGGKVVGSMSLNQFYRATGLGLRSGSVMKLTKAQATKVLGGR